MLYTCRAALYWQEFLVARLTSGDRRDLKKKTLNNHQKRGVKMGRTLPMKAEAWTFCEDVLPVNVVVSLTAVRP